MGLVAQSGITSFIAWHEDPEAQPWIAADVFAAVAEGGIMVDMIVQNVSHGGHASLSFTVPRADLDPCLLLVREVLERDR